MKKILILLVIGLLFSCDNDGDGSLWWESNQVDSELLIKNHKVIVIDECQYILYDIKFGASGYGMLTHKGNCNNPIHCYNESI